MGAEIVAAGLVGALIGSFLNVVIYRLPRGESLVSPGSHCPSCERPMPPYDNVPVLSWLLLRGRCRNCGAPISARYPLVELLTAAAFAAVVAVRGFDDGLWSRAAVRRLPDRPRRHRPRPPAAAQQDRLPDGGYGVGGQRCWSIASDLPEHLIAGAGAFCVPAARVLAYPRRHGHGRREAGRGDGPLPRAVGGAGAAGRRS